MLPVLTYEPLDPATVNNPYPVLAALREQAPVSWHDGMSSWLVTRYADCTAVLRDHTIFARDRRRTGATVPAASLSVQSLDPPHQAGVRSLFMNALRAQDLPALEARARDRAARPKCATRGRERSIVTDGLGRLLRTGHGRACAGLRRP